MKAVAGYARSRTLCKIHSKRSLTILWKTTGDSPQNATVRENWPLRYAGILSPCSVTELPTTMERISEVERVASTFARFGWIGFLLLAASSHLVASDPDVRLDQLYHVSWSLKDGAPPSACSIVQTEDGFLWFGTVSGLYRFDGARFERYDRSSNTPAGESRRGNFDGTPGWRPCLSVGITEWASAFSLTGALPITVRTAAFRQTAEHRNFRSIQTKRSGPPPLTDKCCGSIRGDTGISPRDGQLMSSTLALFSGIAMAFCGVLAEKGLYYRASGGNGVPQVTCKPA